MLIRTDGKPIPSTLYLLVFLMFIKQHTGYLKRLTKAHRSSVAKIPQYDTPEHKERSSGTN